jgi:hypothetical protein
MKVSNVDDVGQMRRRRGTSTKRMMNEQTLGIMSAWCMFGHLSYSQAYHGKQDDPVEEEDVANAETEA